MIAFDVSKLLEQSSERDIYNTGSIVTNYIVTLGNYVEIITMMYTSHLYTVNLVRQKGMFIMKPKHIKVSKERYLLRQKYSLIAF